MTFGEQQINNGVKGIEIAVTDGVKKPTRKQEFGAKRVVTESEI